MIQTGGTLFECANTLEQNGSLSVSAFCTHGIFPNDAYILQSFAEALARRGHVVNSRKTFKEAIEKLETLSTGTHPYNPDAPPHHYGIIACAMRFFLPVFSPYYQAFWEVS